MSKRLAAIATAAVLAIPLALSSAAAPALAASPQYVAAWGSAMQKSETLSASNFTCRTVARTTLGGSSIRLHLSNAFQSTPITFSAVKVAHHTGSGAIAGPVVAVTFGGSQSVTIPAGGEVASDDVPLAVTAGEEIAVSEFVPGAITSFTNHVTGTVTNYCTDFGGGAGNHTGDSTASNFPVRNNNVAWLESVDVMATTAESALVAFGDSLTEGDVSGLNAYTRYPDQLAQRLSATSAGSHISVINEGIGGNTVSAPGSNGPTGHDRFAHDVLAHPGVHYVLLFEGTNDINLGSDAATVIAGLTDLANRAHTAGLVVIGATLIPRRGGWDPADAKDAVRAQVNSWIRTSAPFDVVADFDQAVRNNDPNYPSPGVAHYQDYLAQAYNLGDFTHMTPAGNAALANAVFLPAAGLTNSVVDLSHAGAGSNGFGLPADEVRRWQTFTATSSARVAGVDVKVKKINGSAQTNLVAGLYATSGGLPTGAALASAAVAPDAVGTSYSVVNIPLSYQGLVAGSQYAIVLSQATPNASNYDWSDGATTSGKFGKWNATNGYVDETTGGGNGWLKVYGSSDTSQVDLSHAGAGSNGFGLPADEVRRWQTFTATSSARVAGVDVKVKKINGSAQTNLVASLYATSGGSPTGPVLASASVAPSAVGTSYSVVNIPLSYQGLVAGSQYAIVLSQATPNASNYDWSDGATTSGKFGKWNATNGYVDETTGGGNGWLKVYGSSDTSQVDLSHAGAGSNGFGLPADEVRRWQTFTATSSARVAGVDVKVKKINGSAQTNLVASLYATSGGSPTGPVLASASVAPSAVGTSYSVVNIPLSYQGLVAGSQYAIVLSQATPNASNYDWSDGATTSGKFGKWNATNGYVDETTVNGNGWLKAYLG